MDDINLMSYNDILTSIEIAGDNLQAAKISRDYYEKEMTALAPHDLSGMAMDGMPKGNKSPHTADVCYDKVKKYDDTIERTRKYIIALEIRKKEIEKKLEGMEGLKYQVAKMKLIDCMKLADIADKLGYSESHVKRISAEIG